MSHPNGKLSANKSSLERLEPGVNKSTKRRSEHKAASFSNWSIVAEQRGLAHCQSKLLSTTDLHQFATIFFWIGPDPFAILEARPHLPIGRTKAVTKMTISRWSLLTAAMLGFPFCGCGNGEDNKAREIASKPVAGENRRDAPAAPTKAPLASGSTKSGSAKDIGSGDTDESVNPNDLYAIVESEVNFEIIEGGTNTFVVSRPQQGTSSSHFVAIVPATERPATKPDSRFRLPPEFTVLAEAGYSDEGLPLRIRCEKDGSMMSLVPASITVQGTDDGPLQAGPKFAIYLEPFYIDVTEITLEQFEKYRADVRNQKKRTVPLPLNRSAPHDHPVLGVTWSAAFNYARWADKQLPTEAEWEKAARGPDSFSHPWGQGPPAWSPRRTRTQIDPVRSFRADISPYGIFDLAGNAREWCADWYSEEAYQRVAGIGETAVRNWSGPSRPSGSNQRVVKGNGPDWKVWHRWGVAMSEASSDISFRCVLRGKLPKRPSAKR